VESIRFRHASDDSEERSNHASSGPVAVRPAGCSSDTFGTMADMERDDPDPTGDRPTAEEQIDEVLAAVGDVLGPDVLGAYLHGSSVLGGLRPQSDLDLFVVSRRPTTRDEKRCLVDRLLAVSGRPGGSRRPIELTVVVESEVRPWRYPAAFDLQYGEWLRREFEQGNVEPWPTTTNPDLASLITMVLLADRPLQGPPPSELVDPVPRNDYVSAMVGGLGALLDELESDTRNVVLTLARIWSTVATDVIRSKDDAADWALARLPDRHRAVLKRARAIYRGDEEERWDDLRAHVRAHAEYVVGEIERLTPRRSRSS
jgi:predicted nucleotidyltransferase